MTTMRISLRAGERFYLNGAVLRTDRKVTLELLNNATFLLETHIIQAEQATTPLRQLYFVVQTMLVEPSNAAQARILFDRMLPKTRAAIVNPDILAGLDEVGRLVEAGRPYEALRTLRRNFPLEANIMARDEAPSVRARIESLGAALQPCAA